MENDLISRSALIEEISKGTIITDDLYGMGIMSGVDAVKKKVENAPAVDAVEVVRCKDCICYHVGKDYVPHCNHTDGGIVEYPFGEDFCSYGKRRGDDGK